MSRVASSVVSFSGGRANTDHLECEMRERRMKLGRGAVALAMLAGGLAVSGAGAVPAGAAGETGRLTLQAPMRMKDTRFSGTPAPGSWILIGNGLYDVLVVPHTTSGTADVVACGSPADDHPTFRWSAGEPIQRVVVAGGATMCIVSASSIDVVVDEVGTVAPTAFAGGLQYVPLAEPDLEYFESFTGSPGYASIQIPRPASLPDTVGGGTYVVEALPSAPNGYASLQPCSGPAPLASDLSWGGEYAANVVNVALAPGESPCLHVYGSAIVSVTLLGALTTSGPDPSRVPPALTTALTATPPPGFLPITPTRVLDTRSGPKVAPDSPQVLDLGDHVGPDTTAVTMNVTVTAPDGGGYLAVWPCDEDQPNASNLNFSAGQDVPNLVNVRLAADGTVCIASTAPTHVLADLAGTYEFGTGSLSTPMTPTRILDTRIPIGAPSRAKLAAAQPFTLQVAGQGGLPGSGVTAVTMNVTVTGPQGDGYLTVWPCDQPRPEASNLNFTVGHDVPNLVTVKLSAAGTVCLYATAATDVIADAAQWFSAASVSGYMDLTPKRVLDTRLAIGVGGTSKLPAILPAVPVAIADHAGVPATGATSVTMNVTIASPESDGYLTVWPCDQPRPEASNLNFRAGHDVPNLVTVKLAADGSVCFRTTGTAHVIADVAGYSTATPVVAWELVPE